MAIKTKDQIQKELTKLQTEHATLKNNFDGYKKKVATTVVECLEEYGIEVCDEGLNDFANRIDIELVSKRNCYATIQIHDLELNGTRGRWGWDIDDKEFSSELDKALTSVLNKYGAYYEIDELGDNG